MNYQQNDACKQNSLEADQPFLLPDHNFNKYAKFTLKEQLNYTKTDKMLEVKKASKLRWVQYWIELPKLLVFLLFLYIRFYESHMLKGHETANVTDNTWHQICNLPFPCKRKDHFSRRKPTAEAIWDKFCILISLTPSQTIMNPSNAEGSLSSPKLPEEAKLTVEFPQTKRPNKRLQSQREEQETVKINIDDWSAKNMKVKNEIHQQPSSSTTNHSKNVRHLAFKLDRLKEKEGKYTNHKLFLYLCISQKAIPNG